MKSNYFTVHKNKKPKKVRYSERYTKQEKENIRKAFEYFTEQIELIRIKAKDVVNVNQATIDALNNIAKAARNSNKLFKEK